MRRQARPATDRRGFTLLEVLLALGLGVALMTAVYSAIDLNYQVMDTGRIDLERTQVARALLNQMAVDIRCVTFSDAATMSSSSAADEQATDEEETDPGNNFSSADDGAEGTSVEVIDPTEAYANTGVGVYGDSNTLVLHITKPVRDMNYEAGSDLRSVSYFLAGSGNGTLHDIVGQMAVDNDPESSGTGLARMEGDRLAMQYSDEAGDDATMAEQAQLLAEEVDELRFEYYDGFYWLDEWDSVAMERVPQAIRVTIGLKPHEVEPGVFYRSQTVESTRQFSITVKIPIAQPYLDEMAF